MSRCVESGGIFPNILNIVSIHFRSPIATLSDKGVTVHTAGGLKNPTAGMGVEASIKIPVTIGNRITSQPIANHSVQ
jgi:hypothetical protein